MIGDHHAALIDAFNSITLHSDLVLIVEMLEIAYGRSSNSGRRSWMRKGGEVGEYLSKTRELIYMPYSASQRWWNEVGLHHPSLR